MRVSCWERQFARRDSRGCVEAIGEAEVALWVFGAGVLRARLERSVSWTPGAEGAPREGFVLEVCAVEGTMRRDWRGLLVDE